MRGRPAGVRGSTRLTGVIGWPVEHSLSPAIHNAAFAALGLDWAYVPLPVPPPRLPQAIAGLAALGFAGANVTMPHKTETAGLVDTCSEDARTLRAVNTIVVGAEEVSGHNTDALGFERFLREDAGVDASGRSALVFGAGGAARACALALARTGVASLAVAVRDPSRADDLRSIVEGSDTHVRVLPFDEAVAERADVIVNATPLGVHGESLPLPALAPADRTRLRREQRADRIDLVGVAHGHARITPQRVPCPWHPRAAAPDAAPAGQHTGRTPGAPEGA